MAEFNPPDEEVDLIFNTYATGHDNRMKLCDVNKMLSAVSMSPYGSDEIFRSSAVSETSSASNTLSKFAFIRRWIPATANALCKSCDALFDAIKATAQPRVAPRNKAAAANSRPTKKKASKITKQRCEDDEEMMPMQALPPPRPGTEPRPAVSAETEASAGVSATSASAASTGTIQTAPPVQKVTVTFLVIAQSVPGAGVSLESEYRSVWTKRHPLAEMRILSEGEEIMLYRLQMDVNPKDKFCFAFPNNGTTLEPAAGFCSVWRSITQPCSVAMVWRQLPAYKPFFSASLCHAMVAQFLRVSLQDPQLVRPNIADVDDFLWKVSVTAGRSTYQDPDGKLLQQNTECSFWSVSIPSFGWALNCMVSALAMQLATDLFAPRFTVSDTDLDRLPFLADKHDGGSIAALGDFNTELQGKGLRTVVAVSTMLSLYFQEAVKRALACHDSPIAPNVQNALDWGALLLVIDTSWENTKVQVLKPLSRFKRVTSLLPFLKDALPQERLKDLITFAPTLHDLVTLTKSLSGSLSHGAVCSSLCEILQSTVYTQHVGGCSDEALDEELAALTYLQDLVAVEDQARCGHALVKSVLCEVDVNPRLLSAILTNELARVAAVLPWWFFASATQASLMYDKVLLPVAKKLPPPNGRASSRRRVNDIHASCLEVASSLNNADFSSSVIEAIRKQFLCHEEADVIDRVKVLFSDDSSLWTDQAGSLRRQEIGTLLGYIEHQTSSDALFATLRAVIHSPLAGSDKGSALSDAFAPALVHLVKAALHEASLTREGHDAFGLLRRVLSCTSTVAVQNLCRAAASKRFRSITETFLTFKSKEHASEDSFVAGPAIQFLNATVEGIASCFPALLDAVEQRAFSFSDLQTLHSQIPSLIGKVSFFSPDGSTTAKAIGAALSSAVTGAEAIRNDFDRVHRVYSGMMKQTQNEPLRNAAEKLAAQVASAQEQLDGKPVSQWVPVSAPPGLKPLADKWETMNTSRIFRTLWEEANAATTEDAQSTADEAAAMMPEATVAAWQGQVEKVRAEWEAAVKALGEMSLSTNRAAALLEWKADPVNVAKGMSNSTEAARCARQLSAAVTKDIHEIVDAECAVATEVLPIALNSSKQLTLALRAKSIQGDVELLCRVAHQFGVQVPPNHPIGVLAHALTTNRPVLDVAAVLEAALSAEDSLLERLPAGFLSSVSTVVKAKLPRLCKDYPNYTQLNKVVRRMQIASDPTLSRILDNFLDAHCALSTGRSTTIEAGFKSWSKGKFASLTHFCKYLIEISWAGMLLQRVTNHVETIQNALAEGTPKAVQKTAELLLDPNACFHITSENGAVVLTAVDRDGRKKTQADVTDVASQLQLTGHTADRAQAGNLASFVALHEVLVKKLAPRMQALVDAGHPAFQENRLSLGGDVDLAEVEAQVTELDQRLQDWRNYVSELNCPVLTLIGRRQLVDFVNAVKAGALDKLRALIKTAIPLAPDDAVDREVSQLLERSEGRDASCVYAALGKSMDTLASAHAFPPRLSNDLFERCRSDTTLKRAVAHLSANETRHRCMLTVGEDEHELALLAVFGAAAGRPPAAFEVMQCTAATTQLSMEEFLQRWQAAPLPQALFAITHTEALRPATRAFLVETLARARATAPRLFVTHHPPDVKKATACPLMTALRECMTSIPSTLTTGKNAIASAVLRAANGDQAVVVTSETPQSGKSRAVHASVCGDGSGRGLATFSTDGSVLPLAEQLSNVPIGAHGYHLLLNVAHSFDPLALQALLFTILVLRRLQDDNGAAAVPVPPCVSLFIELPSEGIIAAARMGRLPLLAPLRSLDVPSGVSQTVYHTPPAIGRVFDTNNQRDRSNDNDKACEDMKTPSTEQLNRAHLQAFDARSKGCREVAHHQKIISNASSGVDDTELAKLCREALGHADAPMGKVLRFWRFLTSQLHRVLYFDPYVVATAEEESMDWRQKDETKVRNYRVLAYHHADLVVSTAVELAAEAVAPPRTADEPEDKRLANLSLNFETWRDVKFAFFTAGSFELASIGDFRGIYGYFQQRNRIRKDGQDVVFDPAFEQFLANNLGESLARDVAELRCPESVEAFSAPRRAGLRLLLPILALVRTTASRCSMVSRRAPRCSAPAS